LTRLDPANHVVFCGNTHVDARAKLARDGRVGGQPYRETLDSETLARELDDGVLAIGEYVLRWRSGVVAKVRVLIS
jgi:hypothetical protein